MALYCRKRDLSLEWEQNFLTAMTEKAVEKVAWKGSDISIVGGF